MNMTAEQTGGTAQSGHKPRSIALSPSRAADFKQCPLLYRFRAIDRIPERPSEAQVRGTVVHAVLERLFGLPAGQRTLATAAELVDPCLTELLEREPELTEFFDEAGLDQLRQSARPLLETYFGMEDPSRFDPDACELLVEAELDSGVRLRGYVDRVDVAPTGEVRVVDYKTGAAPRAVFEAKALFQMKFYALALLRLRGEVPDQLKLMYLRDGEALTYAPEEGELRRFERTCEAIWGAIRRAGDSGDFRPSPSKLCDWCEHKTRCPAFGGTPPEYPGWPESPAEQAESEVD
ncbi:PD-(D/E)XK nuclease family protein [Sciscionella marina]|uniref:RecB family exonuclease n=1 Tax=Sciscionella marina TaxID=508770 RepID=UPI00035F5FD3